MYYQVENKIRIPNTRLWEIAQTGGNIDAWLNNEVGYGKWKEHYGIMQLPYRSFSFTDEKDAVLFVLRWA
jgi:hypothetical protein